MDYSWPLFNSAGIVGLLGLTYLMLARGNLCTGRELREKNARIDKLEDSLKTRDHQLSLVLTEAMTTISPVLRAMRAAADAEDSGAST